MCSTSSCRRVSPSVTVPIFNLLCGAGPPTSPPPSIFRHLCRFIRAVSAVMRSNQASMSVPSFTSGRDFRRASQHSFSASESISSSSSPDRGRTLDLQSGAGVGSGAGSGLVLGVVSAPAPRQTGAGAGVVLGVGSAPASWKTSCIIFSPASTSASASASAAAGVVFFEETALLRGLYSPCPCRFRKLRRAAGALQVAQYRNLQPSARQAR
mmetsp:Transcript_2299/g.4912  ORF Transcript_2299/g.4912 Transcript_2299/m.4912 type:complete len:211 (+) Transcript_2299:72-704(+)